MCFREKFGNTFFLFSYSKARETMRRESMRRGRKRNSSVLGICVTGSGALILIMHFLPAATLLIVEAIVIILAGILLCRR